MRFQNEKDQNLSALKIKRIKKIGIIKEGLLSMLSKTVIEKNLTNFILGIETSLIAKRIIFIFSLLKIELN
jgi:hypothetical protein